MQSLSLPLEVVFYLFCGWSAFQVIYAIYERCLYLFLGRKARVGGALPREFPSVTIQLPLFNEESVSRRCIDCVCNMDWPHDKLEVQVLDDSTDPHALHISLNAAAEWREKGVRCKVIHRTDRTGYKAGALKNGCAQTESQFVSLFDADFLPQSDYLKRTIPHFFDSDGCDLLEVGMVQSQWGHLNHNDSFLTQAQSLWVDGHHSVEMCARVNYINFVNFTGTAGTWRAKAISDAGGWRSQSLVEDCELSFRALFAGYRMIFTCDIVQPAELPNTYGAYKSQQKRWTQGWAQLLLLHFGTVIESSFPLHKKIHLLYMMTQLMMWPTMMAGMLIFPWMLYFGAVDSELSVLCSFSVVGIFFCFSLLSSLATKHSYPNNQFHHRLARVWRHFPYFFISAGMTVLHTSAFIDGLFTTESEFVRTPKTGTLAKKGAVAKKKSPKNTSSAISQITRMSASVLYWEVVVAIYLFAWSSWMHYNHLQLFSWAWAVAAFATVFIAVMPVLENCGVVCGSWPWRRGSNNNYCCPAPCGAGASGDNQLLESPNNVDSESIYHLNYTKDNMKEANEISTSDTSSNGSSGSPDELLEEKPQFVTVTGKCSMQTITDCKDQEVGRSKNSGDQSFAQEDSLTMVRSTKALQPMLWVYNSYFIFALCVLIDQVQDALPWNDWILRSQRSDLISVMSSAAKLSSMVSLPGFFILSGLLDAQKSRKQLRADISQLALVYLGCRMVVFPLLAALMRDFNFQIQPDNVWVLLALTICKFFRLLQLNSGVLAGAVGVVLVALSLGGRFACGASDCGIWPVAREGLIQPDTFSFMYRALVTHLNQGQFGVNWPFYVLVPNVLPNHFARNKNLLPNKIKHQWLWLWTPVLVACGGLCLFLPNAYASQYIYGCVMPREEDLDTQLKSPSCLWQSQEEGLVCQAPDLFHHPCVGDNGWNVPDMQADVFLFFLSIVSVVSITQIAPNRETIVGHVGGGCFNLYIFLQFVIQPVKAYVFVMVVTLVDNSAPIALVLVCYIFMLAVFLCLLSQKFGQWSTSSSWPMPTLLNKFSVVMLIAMYAGVDHDILCGLIPDHINCHIDTSVGSSATEMPLPTSTASVLNFTMEIARPDKPIFIAAHHKTGTVLMCNIWQNVAANSNQIDQLYTTYALESQCNWESMKAGEVCIQDDFNAATAVDGLLSARADFYLIQTIRDPLEMVVSAYQYHKAGSEGWCKLPWGSFESESYSRRFPGIWDGLKDEVTANQGMTYQEYLQSVDTETGLATEFRHSMAWNLKDMQDTYRRMKDDPRHFSLRFEEWEGNYNGTLEKMFMFVGARPMQRMLQIASWSDLKIHPPLHSNHVSDFAEKTILREILMANPTRFSKIMEIRHSLDMPF